MKNRLKQTKNRDNIIDSIVSFILILFIILVFLLIYFGVLPSVDWFNSKNNWRDGYKHGFYDGRYTNEPAYEWQ